MNIQFWNMYKLWINFAVKMNVVCLVESDIGNKQFLFLFFLVFVNFWRRKKSEWTLINFKKVFCFQVMYFVNLKLNFSSLYEYYALFSILLICAVFCFSDFLNLVQIVILFCFENCSFRNWKFVYFNVRLIYLFRY